MRRIIHYLFVMGLGLSVTSIVYSEEKIGPWLLECQSIRYPDQDFSKIFLRGQQFDLQSCIATQEQEQEINGRKVKMILKVTPARIQWESLDEGEGNHRAKVLIGPEQKRFELFASCYDQVIEGVCLYFPESKYVNQMITTAMQLNPTLELSLSNNSAQPVSYIYPLDYFEDILTLVQSSYRHMEAILRDHINQFVSSEIAPMPQ